MSGTQWLAENAQIITDAANGGNPAAEAFRLAAGDFGYRLFGLCLFSAGVSSVVGAAFTSVSFLKTLHPFINKYERQFVVGFIAFSTLMMVIVGNAAQLLIVAGAFNGLILPVTLGVMLIASRSKRIVGTEYKHPMPLIVLGAIVVLHLPVLRHPGRPRHPESVRLIPGEHLIPAPGRPSLWPAGPHKKGAFYG